MKDRLFHFLLLTIVSISSTLAAGPSLYADQGSGSWAGIILNGSAGQVGDRLRLTPAAAWQAGSAWFATKQFVQGGFTATFQFQITELGVRYAKEAGADGFAFIIQNSSESALGDAGGEIGYGSDPGEGEEDRGISNSLAIEFDTYDNADQGKGDPNNNHVSVQTRWTAPNSVNHAYSLGATTQIPKLKNGNIHTARIAFGSGFLQVFIDDLTTPVLTVPLVNLGLALDAGSAWVGFTAATGEAWENHDILNCSFTDSHGGEFVAGDKMSVAGRVALQPSSVFRTALNLRGAAQDVDPATGVPTIAKADIRDIEIINLALGHSMEAPIPDSIRLGLTSDCGLKTLRLDVFDKNGSRLATVAESTDVAKVQHARGGQFVALMQIQSVGAAINGLKGGWLALSGKYNLSGNGCAAEIGATAIGVIDAASPDNGVTNAFTMIFFKGRLSSQVDATASVSEP